MDPWCNRTQSGGFEKAALQDLLDWVVDDPAEQEITMLTNESKPPNTERSRRFFPGVSVAVSSAAAVALLIAIGPNPSRAQNSASSDASASAKLSPEDYNFVAQANLGAPFQIDSG
jgi:hypothetical protein